MRRKKGQMIFEFMVAAVLFFGIVLYIMSYLSASMASFSDDFHVNTLHSKALAVSELLVHSKGTWAGATPVSVGLMEGYPVLNSTKMNYFGRYCQISGNYRNILRALNLIDTPFFMGGAERRFNVRIEINETDGTSRMQCGSYGGEEIFAEVSRVALSDNIPPRELLVRVVVW